ncbi:succinate--CoA ligase subunit alpha [Falsiroseomonas sp. CW058]|uniref:succinate--CoA ligase subunit alpha n=1 Tax=Falsiroseomonas sp. CW058 TaxID=3388664 RepID=UPI003D3225AE
MSILIDETTRVLVQGLTGAQGRRDTEFCMAYGTRMVAGVTPGKGGAEVLGVPVFNTVRAALASRPADAAVIYAPPLATRDAALESLDAGLKLLVVLAEFVPRHDTAVIAAAARAAGAVVVGCNTNGIISPGRSKLGGIGGERPEEVFLPGRIGIVSRSGGMSAELGLTLKAGGHGVSTCISMGGDVIPGTPMARHVELFMRDPGTDAVVIFGEPGTDNERGVAEMLRAGRCPKPVVALLAGEFQERYPPGVSFGHVAAMIANDDDRVSAKRRMLRDAGAHVVRRLDEIAPLLDRLLPRGGGIAALERSHG